MKNIESIKQSVRAELSGYSVYFSLDELSFNVEIPESWSGFGLQSTSSVWIPGEWEIFSSVLPTVYKWLNKCVIGTALASDDKNYLVYIYREDNELGLYLGGEPVAEGAPAAKLSTLPLSIRNFYTRLHDGFCFYVDWSMGPSRLQDFVNIDDLADDDIAIVTGLVSFFSNGAGDYIAVTNRLPDSEFYIWWHEQQESPEPNVDAWAVIDAWMGIFLENSDSNKSIIGR
ncbi:hypothetical protein [Pseudomonas abietaniphila]|uniref:hypothetical protein n=1 Tax=Pseudomonas abietaniphila TaxID=89065 RepID=UPI000782CF11|nr:hypothetical protein [Pseudomonas abietaniphila]